MIVLIFLIILFYYLLLNRLMKTTHQSSVLCDGRFYVFSAMLMYSILPPIYGLLTLQQNGGVRVRAAYNATIYTADELLKTLGMSSLLFAGIIYGFKVREHMGSKHLEATLQTNEVDKAVARKKFMGWLVICVVSTFLFYLPFIRGGFAIIRQGGTILDVDRIVLSGTVGKIQEIFFSADIMTVSTVAMIYYVYQMEISQKSRYLILVVTVLLQITGAVMTTRRARGLSIMLCAFIIYIYWYEKKRKKIPLTQIVVACAAFALLYLLEVIMGQRQTNNHFASYLYLFDGISAYDSLLRVTRETPSVAFLSNILYGLFRPIPVFGKYIVALLEMPTDAAPLYHWMAERYTTYLYGGGLAYTPQMEAYLCLGYTGCFLFGIFYGFVFGKERYGLMNLFITAMSFSIARGNIQVLLSLLWPYGVIGYLFYDRFLFERLKLKRKNL